MNILIILLLLGHFVTSCTKENDIISDENVLVTLYFDTRNNSDIGDNDFSSIQEGEGIKTLRVIISDIIDNKEVVECNVYQVYNEEKEQTSLTIMGLRPGTKNFYVVANEASIGLDGENFPKEGDEITSEFLNKIVYDSGRYYFPKLYSEIRKEGLPITGIYSNVQLNENTSQSLQIPIKHVVAKVVMNFINNTSQDIPVTDFQLSSFNPDRTYLFENEEELPQETQYSDYKFDNLALNIVQGTYETVSRNKALLVFYIYETKAGPYQIRMNDNTQSNIIKWATFFNSPIERNNVIVVEATINPSGVSFLLSWDVKDWIQGNNIDVPSFN